MRLILIRHGLTDYNLKKKYCGFTDIGLNNIGKAQAKKIKYKLNRLSLDKVFCSDLKRCWQTAKIIFADKKYLIKKNANLREINFGKWEGLSYSDVLKRYPLLFIKWLKDPFGVDIPGGEKMTHFATRIKKEIKKIIEENSNKTIATVSHFGPMRVILNDILGTKRNFWKTKLSSQSIYIIEYNKLLKPKVKKL